MENTTTLDDLIEINNDRIAGYEKAIEQIKDADLKDVFGDMASQSRLFAEELRSYVRNEGEQPAEGTTAKGKIYRAWMDVKATFSGNDRKTALNSCEFGEDAAQRAYATALEEDDLSEDVRNLIQKQKTALKASHDKIKRLRDKKEVVL